MVGGLQSATPSRPRLLSLWPTSLSAQNDGVSSYDIHSYMHRRRVFVYSKRCERWINSRQERHTEPWSGEDVPRTFSSVPNVHPSHSTPFAVCLPFWELKINDVITGTYKTTTHHHWSLYTHRKKKKKKWKGPMIVDRYIFYLCNWDATSKGRRRTG